MFGPVFSPTFHILASGLIGLVVGAIAGLVVCLILRLKIRGRDVALDGLLGAIAFPLVFVGVLLIPWENTITYYVGDTLVTSTMKHYQHPDMAAYAATILLPALREIWRSKDRGKNFQT